MGIKKLLCPTSPDSRLRRKHNNIITICTNQTNTQRGEREKHKCNEMDMTTITTISTTTTTTQTPTPTTTTMVDDSTSSALSTSTIDKSSNVSSESSTSIHIDTSTNEKSIVCNDDERNLNLTDEGNHNHEYNENSFSTGTSSSTGNLLSSSFISIASNLSMRSGTLTSLTNGGSSCSLFGSTTTGGSKSNLHHGLKSTPTALDFLFLEDDHHDQDHNTQQKQQHQHQHEDHLPISDHTDQSQQHEFDNQSLKRPAPDNDNNALHREETPYDNGLESSNTEVGENHSNNSAPTTTSSCMMTPTRPTTLSTSGSTGGIMITPTIGIRKSSKQLTTRKSVDFAILPPSPKRIRHTTTTGVNSSNTTTSTSSSSDLLQIGPSTSPCYYHIDHIVSSNNANTVSMLPDDSSNNNNNNNNNIILVTPPNTNDCCWTSRQVVDAISTCICPSERIEAITNAIESLDHDNQELHNEEMSTGIDSAMTKHLTFLVYQYRILCEEDYGDGNDSDDSKKEKVMEKTILRNEVTLVVTAIELLYRASSQIVGVSFDRMGKELLQLLVAIINTEIDSRQSPYQQKQLPVTTVNADHTTASKLMLVEGVPNPLSLPLDDDTKSANIAAENDNNTADPIEITDSADVHGDDLLRKSTKILAHLARVAKATKAIAHHKGVLETLLKVIAPQTVLTSTIPWEARLSALWTVANLACNPENMKMMANKANLIPTLIRVANRDFMDRPLLLSMSTNKASSVTSLETTMEVLRSRSTACRAILNLSWSADNKVTLSEYPDLIHLLSTLCVTRIPTSAVSAATSKEFDLCPPSYIPHRMYHRSKTIQDIMLTTRRYAAGAIRNIAAAPRKVKISLCKYHNGRILQVLAEGATNEVDPFIHERIFGTIHNLSNHDTADVILNHPGLLEAIKKALAPITMEGNVDAMQNECSSNDQQGSHDEKAAQADGGTRFRSNSNGSNSCDSSTNSSNTIVNATQKHASAIVTVLERSITEDMTESYAKLRTLLQEIRRVTEHIDSSTNNDSSNSLTDTSTSAPHNADNVILRGKPGYPIVVLNTCNGNNVTIEKSDSISSNCSSIIQTADV